MLKNWTKILPFFIVVWIAKRNCERYSKDVMPCGYVVMPYKDVYVAVKK